MTELTAMAAIVAEPYFAEDMPEVGTSLRFETRDELISWLERQKERWQPILTMEDSAVPKPIRQTFGTARANLNKVFETAAASGRDDAPPEAKESFRRALRVAMVDSRMPLTDVGFPEFLADMRSRRGEAVAASAFGHFIPFNPNVPMEPNHPAARLGHTAAALFQLGVSPDIPKAVSDQLSEMTAQQEAALGGLHQRLADFDATAKEVVETATVQAGEQREHDEALHREALHQFSEASAKAVSDLTATHAAYTEHMHLKAPVAYWTKKGEEHRMSEGNIRRWLVMFTLVASPALVLALLSLAWLASASAEIASQVKYAAIALLVTVVVLWTGRILLRFLISERHLAIDAEERVTMVMTYLALTKEANLEAADRPLVLGPLFRSGSDGIVKEDGNAPDTMVTALMSRAFDRLTGK